MTGINHNISKVLIGSLYLNNIDNKATTIITEINFKPMRIIEKVWGQWNNPRPEAVCYTLKTCKSFRKCGIITYSNYDTNNTYRKYLSKIENVEGVNLTHEIFDNTINTMKLFKHVLFDRNGHAKDQITKIPHHTLENESRKISYSRIIKSDYALAFVMCVNTAFDMFRYQLQQNE